MAVFGHGASKEVIKVKGGHKGGALVGSVSLKEETPKKLHSLHKH